MTPEYAAAVALIEQASLHQNTRVFNYQYTTWIPVRIGTTNEYYGVRLRESNFSKLVPFVPAAPIPAHTLAATAEEFQALVQWMRACETIRNQIGSAYEVLKRVLDMVTTVGQLKRMVPDLIRYLPTEAREALAEQKRRSSLPAAWASTDRAAVREAVDLIARCYLLPKPENNVSLNLNGFDDKSWAFLATPDEGQFHFGGAWKVVHKNPWKG